ncbi:hypothetical protein [Marinicrinis lubricantis]|uniref:Uncharacterized protein n=1 Tax=Marinicrinis lubricantis TaxID=2086470 RepID=A0ABW1IRV1_9BACL
MEVSFAEYMISTDKSKLDHPTIHRLLAATYWASLRMNGSGEY